MKLQIVALLSIASLSYTFSACSKSDDQSEYRQVIEPVYRYMADYKTYDTALKQHIPDSLSDGVTAMMRVIGYDSIDSNLLEQWSNSMPTAVFTPPVDSIFTSLKPIETSLGHILHKANELGLKQPYTRFAAIVWGKTQSIVFADTVMLIALNHYLGEDYPGYGHWPEYQRKTKSPEFLPYDMAEAIVGTQYPFSASDGEATALNRILYEGLLTKAKMELVANADLAEALGYTADQLSWVEQHERQLWQTLVGKNLLYDVSEMTINQLIGPAPSTRILDVSSPGRVGRYIGYKIVKSYLAKHENTTFVELLKPDFYLSPDVLTEANYIP
jgi:hypothetical protein